MDKRVKHLPEQVAEIRRLWDKGFSTQQIGKYLGTSKNTIIGVVTRHKFPPHPERPKGGVSMLELPGVEPCCYPTWDNKRRSARYCQNPTIPFKPYCQEHWTLTHVQKPAPEENAHAG